MTTSVVVIAIIAGLLVLAAAVKLSTRASVPGRLAHSQAAGTGHGPVSAPLADTGRPADAGAEDQFAVAGDAAPGPPPAPSPPQLPVDPDAPGRSVDDPGSGDAVEPNEPA
jgi:hypothetical protein